MESPTTPDEQPKTTLHRGSIRVNVVAQILLALAIFGLVNYLGYRHFKQWDKTYDRQFSISATSAQLLAQLPHKLTISVIAKKGSNEQRDLWQLAEMFKNKAPEKLKIQLVDPLSDLEAFNRIRDEASKFRIMLDRDGGQGLFIRTDKKSAESLEKQAAGDAAGKSGAANFVPMASLYRYQADQDGRAYPASFLGESALAGAIMAISRGDKPNIHIVWDKARPKVTPNGTAINTIADMAARQNMQVHPLFLAEAAEIPPDANCVVIIGPTTDFLPREIDMLRKFWNTPKKSIFIMLNSESDYATPELDKFLVELGVTPQADRVLQTFGTDAGTERVFVVTGEFDSETVLTPFMQGTNIRFPGRTRSLKLMPEKEKLVNEGIKLKSLITASPGFWGETKYLESSPVAEADDNKAPLYLGASLERGSSRDPLVGNNSSRMVVLGNASLLDPDTLEAQSYDLVHSSLQWMLQRENFMGINPRPKTLFRVTMDESQQSKVFLITVVVLPLAVALLGVVVWGGRRS